MREGCYECTYKHIGQALVLLTECVKGYPEHFIYVVGHLAEAEDEIVELDAHIQESIREFRLTLTEDFTGRCTAEQQRRLEEIANEVRVQGLLEHKKNLTPEATDSLTPPKENNGLLDNIEYTTMDDTR